MKKYLVFAVTFFIALSFHLSAQEVVPGQFLYEGTIDEKHKITMFLSVEDPCGGNPYVIGMYQYNDQEEWIELTIAYNEEEGRYCMMEYLFTGVMILKKTDSIMEGIWISPDAKKQLPVKLQKKTLSRLQKELYSEIMEELNYLHNDC